MDKRTLKERIYGRWVVVIDNQSYERFFNETDAKEYASVCNAYGINTCVHHIETDVEDENFGYYFE